MKNLFIAILVMLSLISCSTTQPVSMKPTKASIPELNFSYWKNNSWVKVRGHEGDYFQPGEPKKFKIQSNSYGGECIINYQDGDIQHTYNCESNGETVLDLGQYYVNNPSVVGISVAMKNLGTQVGYMYVNQHPQRDLLPVDFKCPYQNTNQNISVCTRPATYDFNMIAHISIDGAGQVQYIYQCNGGSLVTKLYDVTGPQDLNFQLTSPVANYCELSINYKKVLSTGILSDTMQQHIIHVRFYNNEYIPLALPKVSTTSDGYKVCAGEDYSAFSISGAQNGSLNSGDCVTIKDSTLDFVAWDSIGRMTWAYQSKGMLNAIVGMFTYKNEFKFYQDARPWFDNKTKHCNMDLNCIKKEKTKLLKDNKLVAAIKNWDAMLLYR